MPTLAPGMIDSYQVPERAVDVSPMFYNLQDPQTALFNSILADGRLLRQPEFAWWDDVLMPVKTKLKAAYTGGSGTMSLADAKFVREGSIIECEKSVYRVTASNPATGAISVVVIEGDANHANGKSVEIIGVGHTEGEDFKDTATVKREKRENVCQIFKESVNITGTAEAVEKVNGEVGQVYEEIAKKTRYLYMLIGRTIWNGRLIKPTDNNTPRFMGGVKHFIHANGYVPSAAAFSKANIDAFLIGLKERGAALAEIWCNPAVASLFSGIQDDRIIEVRGEKTVGRAIDRYLASFGMELKIIADDSCVDTNGFYVFNAADVIYKNLRPMHLREIGETGDSIKRSLVTEASIQVVNSQAMGFFPIAA